MRRYSAFIRVGTVAILLAVLFSGCAPTLPFQELDPTQRQSLHRTEFVLLAHPEVQYYWEITQAGVAYHRVVNREILKAQAVQWREKMDYELGLVEVYLANFGNPAPIARDIYFQTLQDALTGSDFIQLQP
ncbi:MAG: hypothetical protein JSW54_04625, partial [Fidelibacterota bacterium]